MESPPDSARSGGPPPTTTLSDLAWLFLKLGAIAFGGPAAHIAMMDDEVVRRRRWLTREAFLDYVGATNLIPGPNSTELAIHIGYARGGWAGLVVAGVSFILPAAVIVTAIAWVYVRYGTRPDAMAVMYAVKPVVVAVVARALWMFARTAIRSRVLALAAIGAAAAAAAGVHELVILGVTAAVIAAVTAGAGRATLMRGTALVGLGGVTGSSAAAALDVAAAVPFGLGSLGLVFLKAGALLFGSGYVLLAFLRADLVERLHWLTDAQLVDAIAIGQVTPGPVFTTATFIGFVLGGPSGAIVATVAIFLPAFVFVAFSGPLIPTLRRSPIAAGALDGVNVASLALMAVVSWQLAHGAIVDVTTIALACISLVALVRYRVNSAWLMAGGAGLGWLLALSRVT